MNSYDNYHLAISKSTYEALKEKGAYDLAKDGLTIQENAPTYRFFMECLKRYGSPWNWDRRPKYVGKRNEIEHRLSSPETRLLTFHKNGKEIGYCLIAGVNQSLSDRFAETANHQKIVEIENLAIAPSENGKGLGRVLLGKIFEDLFLSYDAIYLSSRSTNHRGVIPFYKNMGMSVIHVEKNLPDDLVQNPQVKSEPEIVV